VEQFANLLLLGEVAEVGLHVLDATAELGGVQERQQLEQLPDVVLQVSVKICIVVSGEAVRDSQAATACQRCPAAKTGSIAQLAARTCRRCCLECRLADGFAMV